MARYRANYPNPRPFKSFHTQEKQTIVLKLVFPYTCFISLAARRLVLRLSNLRRLLTAPPLTLLHQLCMRLLDHALRTGRPVPVFQSPQVQRIRITTLHPVHILCFKIQERKIDESGKKAHSFLHAILIRKSRPSANDILALKLHLARNLKPHS